MLGKNDFKQVRTFFDQNPNLKCVKVEKTSAFAIMYNDEYNEKLEKQFECNQFIKLKSDPLDTDLQGCWKFVNGKFVNAVGNLSTAFKIGQRLFCPQFFFGNSSTTLFSESKFFCRFFSKNIPLRRSLLESVLINDDLCQFVNQKQLD